MNRSFISQRRRILPQVMALVVLFFSVLASAQTATNIQITNTVQSSSVKRLGVNLGDQTFYDSGQMLKNLIFQNPGFEPEKYRSIMICAVGGSNSCVDDNQWSPQPSGFWNGASFKFLTGSAAGKSGTVASSTAAAGAFGQTVKFNQTVNAAVGDYFAVTQNFPGHGDAGWWDSTAGGGSITSETNDLSPETPGTQAIRLNASSSGQSASVTSYFDSEDGISFIQMNGAFAITFRAKGVGGNNHLSINMQRTNTSGNLVYVNKTLTLTNAWADYTLTFNASETGSANGTAQLVFTASGSSVELDDVSLEQTNSSASNPTAFRDDVVNALTELKPGTIRMMAGDSALGSDLINQIQVPFARYRMGWTTGGTETDTIAYGIHELLQLCETVGADPWITIPTATTTTEMQAFIQYLTGNGSDPYSALRISRGQTAPWTSVFNKIHLELGNETWNGSFRGESMTYDGYPYQANTVFGAARATSGYVASKFDLVLDGLAASAGYNAVLLQRSTKHDSMDAAPYLLFSANNEAQSKMFGALFAEPELFDSTGGEIGLNVATAKAAPTSTYLNVYETNLSPIEGSITETQLNNLTPSIGAGLAHTDHMLQMMRAGVVYQNAFSLPQYAFQRDDGLTVKLWGITRDMGTTNRKRPQFLTQALANSVIGGNMLKTAQTGANPTWNQPLSSDNVQLNGAHYLQSFAFQNGSKVSVVVFNLNQTTALPVTFSGNAPSGSVEMTQITSSNITDSNESSQVVAPTTQTLSSFNPAKGLTLPPFSMTVLTAAGSTTQAPVFTPAAGSYSSAQSVTISDGSSGATIYYTTDGSTPTTSSTKYTGAIKVSASKTVNAIAVASGLSASPVTSAAYVISSTSSAQTAAPSFSVGSGTYNQVQKVTLSSATSGAAIYYTTNGATPTTSSTKYTGAITVSTSETLKAITVAPNGAKSSVSSAAYTLQAANPKFSVASGTYNSTFTVTLTDATSGASIAYEINGGSPVRYTAPITVNKSMTIVAGAGLTGFSTSNAVTVTYTLQAAAPTFSVASGSYSSAQSVALSSKTSGAAIYYTTDGATPTTASTKYTGTVKVSSTATVKAVAVATNLNKSPVSTAAYTIQAGPPSAPIFSVAGGTYNQIQKVTIRSATSGAAIYYTTNGAAPTTSSTRYMGGALIVNGSETLKAIAVDASHSQSAVSTAAYTLKAADPHFSVKAGTYGSAFTLTMSSATAGAEIGYEINGGSPVKYTGPITVNKSMSIIAGAAASGFQTSNAVTASYVIK